MRGRDLKPGFAAGKFYVNRVVLTVSRTFGTRLVMHRVLRRTELGKPTDSIVARLAKNTSDGSNEALEPGVRGRT